MALVKKILVLLAALVALLLGLTIGIENSAETSFMLMGLQLGPFTMGTWTLLVFGGGLFLGVLLTLPPWMKSQRIIKRYQKRFLVMEKKAAEEKTQKGNKSSGAELTQS